MRAGNLYRGSALHADDLFQGMDDGDQVPLIFHDLVDVFVGRRYLIHDTAIFATDYALGLPGDIRGRIPFARRSAAHAPARAVGA